MSNLKIFDKVDEDITKYGWHVLSVACAGGIRQTKSIDMDDLVGDIVKGFFRGIGYILAEIFFRTVCYWIGWPICKAITLGHYPLSKQIVSLGEYGGNNRGFWCSAVGLVVLIFVSLLAAGQF